MSDLKEERVRNTPAVKDNKPQYLGMMCSCECTPYEKLFDPHDYEFLVENGWEDLCKPFMNFREQRECILGNVHTISYGEDVHPLTAVIYSCGCLAGLDFNDHEKLTWDYPADGFNIFGLENECSKCQFYGTDEPKKTQGFVSEKEVREQNEWWDQLTPERVSLLRLEKEKEWRDDLNSEVFALLSQTLDELRGLREPRERWVAHVSRIVAAMQEKEAKKSFKDDEDDEDDEEDDVDEDEDDSSDVSMEDVD